jgi:hypothetical protein
LLKKLGQLSANFISALFTMEKREFEHQHYEDCFRIVEQARREWQEANMKFEQATDPDLIDSTIYAIESAEKRYVYLLKKVREEKSAGNCTFF